MNCVPSPPREHKFLAPLAPPPVTTSVDQGEDISKPLGDKGREMSDNVLPFALVDVNGKDTEIAGVVVGSTKKEAAMTPIEIVAMEQQNEKKMIKRKDSSLDRKRKEQDKAKINQQDVKKEGTKVEQSNEDRTKSSRKKSKVTPSQPVDTKDRPSETVVQKRQVSSVELLSFKESSESDVSEWSSASSESEDDDRSDQSIQSV